MTNKYSNKFTQAMVGIFTSDNENSDQSLLLRCSLHGARASDFIGAT